MSGDQFCCQKYINNGSLYEYTAWYNNIQYTVGTDMKIVRRGKLDWAVASHRFHTWSGSNFWYISTVAPAYNAQVIALMIPWTWWSGKMWWILSSDDHLQASTNAFVCASMFACVVTAPFGFPNHSDRLDVFCIIIYQISKSTIAIPVVPLVYNIIALRCKSKSNVVGIFLATNDSRVSSSIIWQEIFSLSCSARSAKTGWLRRRLAWESWMV